MPLPQADAPNPPPAPPAEVPAVPVGDARAPNPPPAPVVEVDLPRAGLVIGQNCQITIHNIYMGGRQ